jgi:DNA-binding transcriptional regulator YdaS (Cro superfamily)
MKLSDYIKTHGIEEAAKRLGISKAAAKSYLYGWRQPRPEVAMQIVTATGGEVSLAEIYAQRSRAA